MSDHLQKREPDSDERGFVMVMVGLLIIPIVAFTALAVDVSSWYSRATELQRASDAASLAGVVWMPHLSRAQDRATPVLTKAGLVDGTDDIVIEMSPGDEESSFKVCVSDNSVTQFFGAVIGGATKLKRCSVAKFDRPLEMGSPLNFLGGDDSSYSKIAGQPAVPPTPEILDSTTPPDGNYNIEPKNYDTPLDSSLTWWYSTFWRTGGCKAVTSTSGTSIYGYYWGRDGVRRGWTGTRMDNVAFNYYQSGWSWTSFAPSDLPDCLWDIPATPGSPATPDAWPIRPEMNPRFWLSVEAPGTDAVQGDRFSPKCYGAGMSGSNSSCATSRPNPDFNGDPTDDTVSKGRGYYFPIEILDNNPKVLIQIFDAKFDRRNSYDVETGERVLSSAGEWTTHYEILQPDGSPYDPTDNEVATSGQCGTENGYTNARTWALTNNDNASTSSEFKNTWRTICTLTSPGITTASNSPWYLHVWTTGRGNASNSFAVRTIAAGADADANDSTTLDAAQYPLSALDIGLQPSISALGQMPIYVNVSSGRATFFLANVGEDYAGNTLILDLYDSAEGATSVRINTPNGPQNGGCSYSSTKLRDGESGGGSGGGGSIGSGGDGSVPAGADCIIPTGGSKYNGRLLSIKIPVPPDYTCTSDRPSEVNDTTWTGNGCWWSITYNVTDAHDQTTWGARMGGDPVRIIE